MPLPLLLGAGAAILGALGIGGVAHGGMKAKEAKDTMKAVQNRYEWNMDRAEKANIITTQAMDELGKKELEILNSFIDFADVFEQIKNRPCFETYKKSNITLPQYDGEKLKKILIGAGTLLGSLGGAGLGAAGGFAAAGATSAAVMAFGSASTGTAIISLNGIALTNATLAALGGGAIATGGGGVALGTMVLGATTLGVGLLVGGIIFNFTGEKLSDKAYQAWLQVKGIENKINEICKYLSDLKLVSKEYLNVLCTVYAIYERYLARLKYMVIELQHTDWENFSLQEKELTENTVLMVGLLYNMCKVELVLKNDDPNGINTINRIEIGKNIRNAKDILNSTFPTSGTIPANKA